MNIKQLVMGKSDADWKLRKVSADVFDVVRYGVSIYKVKKVGKHWQCTCSGYAFRGQCEHVDAVKNELRRGVSGIHEEFSRREIDRVLPELEEICRPFEKWELVGAWRRNCFVADTMVMTEYGYFPIQGIQVGDRVYNGLGKLVNVVDCQVGHYYDLVKIEDGYNPSLTCPYNHKILVVKEDGNELIPVWEEAWKIDKFYTVWPSTLDISSVQVDDLDVNKAFLLGWMVASAEADGSVIKLRVNTGYNLTKEDINYIFECGGIGAVPFSVGYVEDGRCGLWFGFRNEGYINEVYEASLVFISDAKCALVKSSWKIISKFLVGYWWGNGIIYDSYATLRVRLSSIREDCSDVLIKKKLAYKILSLLMCVRINGNVLGSEGGSVSIVGCPSVSSYHSNCCGSDKFVRLISDRLWVLKCNCSRPIGSSAVFDPIQIFGWIKMTEFSFGPPLQSFYGITVDGGDPSYIANGVIVHNCSTVRDMDVIALATSEQLEKVHIGLKSSGAWKERYSDERSIYGEFHGCDIRFSLCASEDEWLWRLLEGTGCLGEDTRVLTCEGLKCIKDIKVGDKVFDGCGKKCRVTNKRVSYSSRMIVFRFNNGSVYMTSNHNVLTRFNDKDKYKEAQLFSVDNVLVYPLLDFGGDVLEGSKIGLEEAFVLGVCFALNSGFRFDKRGDGVGYLSCRITVTDLGVLGVLKSLDHLVTCDIKPDGELYQVCFPYHNLRQYLDDKGNSGELYQSILGWGAELQFSLLKGFYIMLDVKDRGVFDTTFQGYDYSIIQLLWMVVKQWYYVDELSSYKDKSHKVMWEFTVEDEGFGRNVRNIESKGCGDFVKVLTGLGSGYNYVRTIKSVIRQKESRKKYLVYDITTDSENKSFLIEGGFVVHNSVDENKAMRARAIQMGYTITGNGVEDRFTFEPVESIHTEEDFYRFFGYEYRSPEERDDTGFKELPDWNMEEHYSDGKREIENGVIDWGQYLLMAMEKLKDTDEVYRSAGYPARLAILVAKELARRTGQTLEFILSKVNPESVQPNGFVKGQQSWNKKGIIYKIK